MFVPNTNNCQWANGSGRNKDLAKPSTGESVEGFLHTANSDHTCPGFV